MNTIKKTNTRCKLGLFIWLLSFNTLSSCVNTGQTLGMWVCQLSASKKKQLQNKLNEQIQNESNEQTKKNSNPNAYRLIASPKTSYCDRWNMGKYSSPLVMIPAATALTTIVVGGIVLVVYNYFSSDLAPLAPNPMEAAMNNNTMLSPTGNGTINPINTTLSSVGTAATATVTTLATTLIAKLKPNQSTSTAGPLSSEKDNRALDVIHNSKWGETSTTEASKPSGIKLTALTQDIIDDIAKHRFSIKRIQHWLNKGLSIDATDADGRTLLMEVVNHNLPQVVKFLVGKAANVNAQDNRNNTALMYAIDLCVKAQGRCVKAQDIFDYLIKHSATPCIQNVDGRPKQSEIDESNNESLKNKFKQCP